MYAVRQQWISPEEYLEMERQAETRSEYIAGEIFAMAGASRTHNLILTNTVISIGTSLDPTGLYTYPDVVIVCGQPQFKDANEDTLLNPTVIMEVLSDSTASYDRGEKFEHYGTLPSLTDYLLIAQDRAAIEQRVRTDRGWQLAFHYGLDAVVPLPSIGCELHLSDVYDRIEFANPQAARGSFRIVKEEREEYQPGGDLPGVVLAAVAAAGMDWRDRDVLVVAQKIVSKAEGRRVHLPDVLPSARAQELAGQTGKDPRLVEVILGESAEVLRVRPGLLVVEHRLGFVCANAGVDQSNVAGSDDWALLLPADPDASARRMRDAIQAATGVFVAVIVSDSHGRAWRFGTVGVAIGVAGLHPGRPLQNTEVGTADEIAAAAGLAMGQAGEGTPAVLVRGATFMAGEGQMGEILRPRAGDLFR